MQYPFMLFLLVQAWTGLYEMWNQTNTTIRQFNCLDNPTKWIFVYLDFFSTYLFMVFVFLWRNLHYFEKNNE